jgi:hypothetical protein
MDLNNICLKGIKDYEKSVGWELIDLFQDIMNLKQELRDSFKQAAE